MITHPSSQNIKVAVDAVILRVVDAELQTLLIQMKKEPYDRQWAFPGGLIDERETTLAAARRVLKDQTGLDQAYLEQLRVFDAVKRDVRGRVLSVAHFALIGSEPVTLRTTDKYMDVSWQSFRDLPRLAYDHADIATAAQRRICERLESSDIARCVLPKSFTLTQLQAAYEALSGEPADKRNFRKKMDASGLIKPTGRKTKGGAHRPAELWRFK